MALGNFDQAGDGSKARNFSGFVLARALAANVAETITIPTGANRCILSSTANFYVMPFATATLAADITLNGTFATDTVWTKGTGWTIAAGVGTATGAISTALAQTPTNPVIAGRAYLVTFTCTAFTAGTITPNVGGTAGTARGSAATFSEVILAGSDGTITFTTSGFTGSIDNVLCVPVAIVPVDDTTGNSAELIQINTPAESRTFIVTGLTSLSVVAPGTAVVTASFFNV